MIDEVHWVGALPAFAATRQVHREHALFMGPTSGAAVLVAAWYARKCPDAVTVVILPDEGYRYQNTVYDDEWLAALAGWPAETPERPVTLSRIEPHEEGAWTRSEEHTSELQSLMRISYAVFCLTNKKKQ